MPPAASVRVGGLGGNAATIHPAPALSRHPRGSVERSGTGVASSGRRSHACAAAADREVIDRSDFGSSDVFQDFHRTKIRSTVAGNLPYGYQKSLGIMVALAAEPHLILFDEPVAGLSAPEADHVRDTLARVRARGITAVVIDHNRRFIAGLCDRVVVLHHGQELAQGRPAEVLADARVIEAYLGTGHGAARRRRA